MRKIFGGALLFSVVGAVLFGGVLAWKSTQIASNNSATVGDLNWTLLYTPNNSLIGPNGNDVKVGEGAVTNNGDFNIKLDAPAIGEVTVSSVDVGHQLCQVTNFHGAVYAKLGSSLAVIPDGGTGGDFYVNMLVDQNAPLSCVGATISYDVAINVITTGSNP
ncbi:MAG: hypothetical protein IT304_03875 [Dehalococcoidia bacterium]|nr:hypothetical protein [Dehalococcoidia bacterium]